MNRQSVYGVDVLSRITYAAERGMSPLVVAIRAQIQGLLRELADRNELDASEIGTVIVAGNTTRLHFIAAEVTSGIGRAPFTPAFLDLREHDAAGLDLTLGPEAWVLLLPSVSAYIGADIVNAAVAVDLDKTDTTTSDSRRVLG